MTTPVVDVESVDSDIHVIDVYTPKTLVREDGRWYEYEGPVSVEALERADQVRGADKSTRWCLFHGRLHTVDKDIARELVDAGFGDRLRLLEKPPPPPAPRAPTPAYDVAAAAREISELRAIVDQQGAEIAELRKKK